MTERGLHKVLFCLSCSCGACRRESARVQSFSVRDVSVCVWSCFRFSSLECVSVVVKLLAIHRQQTTSTAAVVSTFVCTGQALDSRRTLSNNMCCGVRYCTSSRV